MSPLKALMFTVVIVMGLVFALFELEKPNFKSGDCISKEPNESWQQTYIMHIIHVGKVYYNLEFMPSYGYNFDEKIKNIDSDYKKVNCVTGRPI